MSKRHLYAKRLTFREFFQGLESVEVYVKSKDNSVFDKAGRVSASSFGRLLIESVTPKEYQGHKWYLVRVY